MTLLNIDDDKIALMLNKFALKKCACIAPVLDFENGALAYDYLTTQRIPNEKYLLLLDINMPVMGAWELLDRLRHADFVESIKVSIVSSSIDKSDRERAFSYPCVLDYLVKPIQAEALHRFLKSALEIH